MLYTNAYMLTKTVDNNPTPIKAEELGYQTKRRDDHDASSGVIHGVLIGGMIWTGILALLFL